MVLIGSQPESGVVADTVWCPTVLVKGIKMQVNITIKGIITTVKALTYAFPKKGNAPVTQKFTVNGKEADTAQTGGGKYPTYIYFKHEGASYYLPKNQTPDNLSDIVTIAEAPKAAPAPVAAKEEKPMDLPPSVEPVAAAVVKAAEAKSTKGNKRK
jgi:hypothetical protein